jgi:RNA polymerase sigma factor (sigma-70 family)
MHHTHPCSTEPSTARAARRRDRVSAESTTDGTRSRHARERYVAEAYTALRRRLRADGVRAHPDAADAAQIAAERLVRGVDEYIVRYPSPLAIAVALATTASAEFRRRERAQRGEGARLQHSPEGEVTCGRQVVAIADHVMRRTARPGVRTSPGVDAVEERGYTGIDDLDLIVRLVDGLPERMRALLWLVRGEGRDVTEAAAMLGLSRSHASRQLSLVEQRVRSAMARLVPAT